MPLGLKSGAGFRTVADNVDQLSTIRIQLLPAQYKYLAGVRHTADVGRKARRTVLMRHSAISGRARAQLSNRMGFVVSMRDGERALMLQFITTQGDVVYINPQHVSAVLATTDESCSIHTLGEFWMVKGSAAEAQLRIWKALAK
jgi:hypothetical protein